MKKLFFLSHSISCEIPAYGAGMTKIYSEKIRSIERGDPCDISSFSITSHSGTHVDAPAHFFKGGQNTASYPPSFWIFQRPFLKKINAIESQILDIKDLSDVPSDADILLIKTGFQRFRETGAYCYKNPGISPNVGVWLRRYRPSIRALGIDFISISSFTDRELGHEAHRAFLNPAADGHPILIIEDMDLSADIFEFKRLFVLPLRIESADSSPVTIIGEAH